MLDKVMMERKEVRKDYDERLAHLEIRMGELQRQCRSMGIPIVIVFEGFSASGKGTMIGRMIRPLDPRGFQVFTMEKETKEDSQNLDEVVVVGYGVSRKKDLTGAVSVLKIDDLKDTPVSSVDQMMQGKLSGVNVMPDNMPGGGVAVRIRGYSTIRNNDPLYIIDGIPVDGGINFLNPNDIESMQVLKDASSASIYGARAANGYH